MKSAKKFVSGNVTKRVDCEGCGRSYEYDMSRTVMGSSSRTATTQAEADAQAQEDANTKLQTALATECDAVCCPACGALTKAMKARRWKHLGDALACTGVGLGILLAVFVLMLIMHRILIFGALGGAFCVLLGLIIFAAGAKDMIAPRKGRL
jgi:hypothetical protein